jgi:hypothetical protein
MAEGGEFTGGVVLDPASEGGWRTEKSASRSRARYRLRGECFELVVADGLIE